MELIKSISPEQLAAYVTSLTNKPDSECTPQELKAKQAIDATSTAEKEKKKINIRAQCMTEAGDLAKTLDILVQNQAMLFGHNDVFELNNLKTTKKEMDNNIKIFVKNSDNAKKYIEVEKDAKKVRAKIAPINKEANNAGLQPIVSMKRNNRTRTRNQKPNEDVHDIGTGTGNVESNSNENTSDSNENQIYEL